ncbi:hypothetical protein AB9D59_10700 [Blautia producta]
MLKRKVYCSCHFTEWNLLVTAITDYINYYTIENYRES